MILDAKRRPPGVQAAVVGRILVICTSDCRLLAIGFLSESEGLDRGYARAGGNLFWEAYVAGSDAPIELDAAMVPS